MKPEIQPDRQFSLQLNLDGSGSLLNETRRQITGEFTRNEIDDLAGQFRDARLASLGLEYVKERADALMIGDVLESLGASVNGAEVFEDMLGVEKVRLYLTGDIVTTLPVGVLVAVNRRIA